jgi:hypothetical protein
MSATAGSKVMVSLRVRATPERAFEAFVGGIGSWWRPNALFAFTPHGFANAVFLTRHAEWWQALLASYKHAIGDGEG